MVSAFCLDAKIVGLSFRRKFLALVLSIELLLKVAVLGFKHLASFNTTEKIGGNTFSSRK